MSGRYRLTLKAAEDLKAINDYTGRTWGNEQRRKYLGELRQRFRWLAENPRLGREGRSCAKTAIPFPKANT